MPSLSLLSVETIIHDYGYAGVFLGLMLESMGLPMPGESLMIAASAFAATTGELNIALLVPIGAAGAICGDQIGYLVGRTLGERVLTRWGGKVGITPDHIALGNYLFRHYGGRVVFFGRFITLLRTFAALLAGMHHMPWQRFFLFNVAGGLCWASLWGFGTYALGDAVERLRGPAGIGLGAAVVLGAGIGLLYVRRHADRLMAEARREAGLG